MAVGETAALEVITATAPARWLLDAGRCGIPLTQTHALARSVVREAAERWPEWWDAERFGAPHREADLAVLHALHDGLRRTRLVRRRGRRLLTTVRGRELGGQPAALLPVLAADLDGGDPFTGAIASAVVEALRSAEPLEFAELDAVARARVQRAGWRRSDGTPVSRRDAGWAVGDVLRRGEAYGLIQRHPDPGQPRRRGSRVTLTAAARTLFGGSVRAASPAAVYLFDAQLTGVRGVRAGLAVRADQPLSALHDAIQQAFGWYDDHLYSFWLDGEFWGDRATEFTSPVATDGAVHTADVPLDELDLAPGARLAYVFDFGDEWRVRLTLRGIEASDGARYPRVLRRTGQAPPQYPALDDDE